jgi:hypothetical protein
MLHIVRSSFHSDFDVAQDDTAEKAQGEAVAESRAFLRRSWLWHLCRVQHIFNENSVPRGGIVDEDMGDSPHELSVLNDRRSRQVCGQ